MRALPRRVAVPPPAQRRLDYKTFPAPVRGWVVSENLATSGPASARVLDNWFPTTEGIRVRGGSNKYATIASSAPAISMWTYRGASTEKLFAADATNVFDISSIGDADAIPTAAMSGRTSGYYCATQIGTAGGDYQFACNGDDPPLLYDGTAFDLVSDATERIAYDAETGTFTAGLTVTGGTSAATATIVDVVDNGTTGELRVKSISGTFQDNETITDSSTGSATSNIPSGVVSATATITGVTTSNLSFSWTYASRLFFVEKDTMNAWYLGVDAIGGTASSFSLAGVFQQGGSLLFGGVWSLDSGAGLDDKCVFVSTEGEVAVYEGTNPGSASTWSRIGIYRITKPLGPKAAINAGGDLLIATKDGIVPLSEAVRKDVAALSLAAISRPIQPVWADEVADRVGINWEMLKWDDNDMLVVSQPIASAKNSAQCLVANLETGAWCRFTVWDTRCLAVYNDVGYYGTNDGEIFQMEVGGTDNGATYTAVYVGQFDHFGAPGLLKTVQQARSIWLASGPFNQSVSVAKNYEIAVPTAPSSVADYTVDEWDVGLWDVAQWDSASQTLSNVTSQWQSIGKTGYSIAPVVQITSGTTPKPLIELVALDLTWQAGGLVN